MIVVSHDREFLDGLVSKVYEFAGGKVTEHLGGIYDYLRSHNAETIHEAIADATTSKAEPKEAPEDASADTKQSYLERKEKQKKIKKAARAVENSESKIASMERRLKQIDQLLALPENASNIELVTEYTSTKAALDKENDNWMALSENLEQLEQ